MTRWEPVLLSPENACPAICTVAFPGFEGAVLMRLLASRGVLVSAGSACHAESGRTSHVLKAMGIDERTARGALRISFGPGNTAEDVHDFLGELCTVMDEY
jgi:cysteine desulfurase